MSTDHQLHQDLRLLDVLEALPRPGETNTAALQERLTHLCAAQSIEATPERIDQAVTHYLAGHRLPVPATLPWTRAASREAWETLRQEHTQWLVMAAKEENIETWVAIVSFFAVLTTSITLLVVNGHGGGLFCGLVGTMIGLPVGVLFGGATSTLWAKIRARGTKARRRRAFQAQWCDLAHGVSEQLDEARPDLERMKRWLTFPASAEVLRQIACTTAPLTVRDAVGLDALDVANEAQLREQNQVQEAQAVTEAWKHTLHQLAQASVAPTPNQA